MIFFQIIIPNTKKFAKVLFLSFLIVYLAIWGIVGCFFLNEQHKLNSWTKVDAVVIDYEWSTLETTYDYEIDGKTYTKVQRGLLYKGEKGDKKTLLCPSKNEPKKCIFELELTKTSGVKIFAEVLLVFIIFPLFYGIIYVYFIIKEKKKGIIK